MDIKNYKFRYNRRDPMNVDCYVTTPDNVTFGAIIHSPNNIPDDNWMFNVFKTQKSEFFIEAEVKITSEPDVVEVKEEIKEKN